MDLLRRERLTPHWDQGGWLALRILLGLVAAAGLAMMAFWAMFIGVVTLTGCFISCGDPNVPAGAALLLLAVALAATALASLWWALVDRSWPTAWRVIGVLAVLAAVGLPLAAVMG